MPNFVIRATNMVFLGCLWRLRSNYPQFEFGCRLFQDRPNESQGLLFKGSFVRHHKRFNGGAPFHWFQSPKPPWESLRSSTLQGRPWLPWDHPISSRCRQRTYPSNGFRCLLCDGSGCKEFVRPPLARFRWRFGLRGTEMIPTLCGQTSKI